MNTPKKLPKVSEETIKKALIDELSERNMINPYYVGLVEDYVRFYKVALLLYADIEERGVRIKWENSATSHGYKKNDNVAEYTKVNMQMLKILNELGLRGANIKAVEPDETL